MSNWISSEREHLLDDVVNALFNYERYVQKTTNRRGHVSPQGRYLQNAFKKYLNYFGTSSTVYNTEIKDDED